MKTATTLPTPALSDKPKVKQILTIGIIYLTSEKLFTFANVIAALCEWWGICTDNSDAIVYGAIVWLVSFALWAWRQVARDLRNCKIEGL